MCIRPLDEEAAWDRLGTVSVGRVSTSLKALPIIVPVLVVPVRFAGGHDHLVFAVTPASALARALDGSVFAFEASGHDDRSDTWWAVLVRGHASLDDLDGRASRALERLELPGQLIPAVGTVELLRAGEMGNAEALPFLGEYLTST